MQRFIQSCNQRTMAFALFVTTSAFLLGPSTPPLMSTARRPLIAVVMDEQQQQQKRTDIDVTAAKTSLLDKLKGGGDRLALALEGRGDDDVLEEIARRFKSQTLISADEITFEEKLEEAHAVVDTRDQRTREKKL